MGEHHRELGLPETPALAAPIAGHDDERLTAFHEAGHVVMCVIQRMMPTRVTILRQVTPAGALSGRVHFGTHRRRWFARPQGELDVLLAGMVAEARFHQHHAETAGTIDRAEALNLAMRHARSAASAARWVAARLAVVERRFADPAVWSATMLVATALLERKSLEGRAMLDLCRQTAELVHRRDVAMWKWPGYATVARTAFSDGLGPELQAALRSVRRRRTILIVLAILATLARIIGMR